MEDLQQPCINLADAFQRKTLLLTEAFLIEIMGRAPLRRPSFFVSLRQINTDGKMKFLLKALVAVPAAILCTSPAFVQVKSSVNCIESVEGKKKITMIS